MKRLLTFILITLFLTCSSLALASGMSGGGGGAGAAGNPGGSRGDPQCNIAGAFGACLHLVDTSLLPLAGGTMTGSIVLRAGANNSAPMLFQVGGTLLSAVTAGALDVSNDLNTIYYTIATGPTRKALAFADGSNLAFTSDAQDDIPVRGATAYGRLNLTEQTVLGRITGGHVKALSVAEVQTLIGLGASGQHADAYFLLAGGTATSASSLASQYIDWNQTTGGNSIANKPTLATDNFTTSYPGGVCKDNSGNIVKCTLAQGLNLSGTTAPTINLDYNSVVAACNTSLTAGRSYYIASNGTCTAANATSATTLPTPAICVATSSTICVTRGSWTTTGLTPGAPYYVPVATGGGALTASPPSSTGNEVQRVAIAESATILHIMVSPDVFEVK